MLRRYQNELMVLAALLLLTAAVMFKTYRYRMLQTKSAAVEEMVTKIEDIATMKKLWSKNKTVSQKLGSIKNILKHTQIKTFQIEKKKAHIILENLNGSELNRISGKYLASIPVQITEISIVRNGAHYRLELRCKW